MTSKPAEDVKLMPDYGAWPLWSMSDGVGLAPEALPLSDTLRTRLRRWAAWHDDRAAESDYEWPSEAEAQRFEAEGEAIAVELRRELPDRRVFYLNNTTNTLT